MNSVNADSGTLKLNRIERAGDGLIIPDILNNTYLPSLNGIRAVSILIVLYAHTLNGIYGGLGVQIFFVISGFLITTLLIKEYLNTSTINLKAFYLRRIIRILPVAYLCLLATFVLNYCFKLGVPAFHFLLAFFFLTNIVGGAGVIGHYWSLATEEQFYLIFPYFIKLNINRYFRSLFVVLGLIIIVDFMNLDPYQFTSRSVSHYLMYLLLPLRKFDAVIIGSLMSVLLFKTRIDLKSILKYKILLHIILVPCVIYLYSMNYSLNFYIFPHPLCNILGISIIAFLILLNIIESSDIIYKLLNHVVMARIGILSYSIYIWQEMFTRDIPWKNTSGWGSNVFLNLLGLAVISSLSFYFYERPFLKLKSKIK